ncbi:MAG TPA: hypothetical protein VLG10_09065 [Methylomirabilota bacterium]|nr:hypothetical protein [Methylomirabilota bacterium]
MRVVGSGIGAALALAGLLLAGCSSVSVRTQPYLGVPRYPASDPARVEILGKEPERSKDRLGEIFLDIEGSPSRETIEARLRDAVAELGGDAAFIVFDQTRLFPVVYADPYYGTTVSETARRGIVAVAIKYR